MKYVNFTKIAFEDNDFVDDDYEYESVKEKTVRYFGWVGTFKKECIVKNIKDKKLYKTWYYISDDGFGSVLSCGIDGELDCGGNGYCKLIEVKKVGRKYDEIDNNEVIDERNEEY